MSALSIGQLKRLVDNIKTYGVGSQLQDIFLTEKYLFLQHYGKGEFTLALELNSTSPELGYFFGETPRRKFLVKPIVLFLKAHARNLRLYDVVVQSDLGRVLSLHYKGGEERGCTLQLRLIPRGMNVIVEGMGKSISLFPTRELPPSTVASVDADPSFDVEAYLDSWMGRLMAPPQKKNMGTQEDQQHRKKQKEIEKKKTLILKLEGDLEALSKPWQAVGEFIKTHQSLDVPEEWISLVELNLPVNSNMQLCFEKHKLQEKRRQQLHERLQHLESEIQGLEEENSGNPSIAQDRPIKSLASELLGKAKAKGRKLVLAEQIEAVFGKSAKDNLSLLRKAQPWDLWLHLRDLPGAHLIIRRPRQKHVDHTLLLSAARWLLAETVGKKKVITGDRYDVIVTECRFVKPIRGDRLGRVNYQNESTLVLRA